jgi:hypothetical protein
MPASSKLPPVSNAPPQANYTNSQTFDIDISQYYSNIITVVDQVRSHVSVAKNAQAINSMVNALANTTNPSADPYAFVSQFIPDPNAPQESRCHAFYRLLGLPVIAPNGLLYSPGYDINTATFQDPNVRQNKLNVIKNLQSSGLFAVMDARETYVSSLASIFSLSNQASNLPNINASILALSSVAGGNVRAFSSSLVNSADPFDADVSDQTYSVGALSGQLPNSVSVAVLASRAGNAGYLSPTGSYASIVLNNLATSLKSPLFTRGHILKPFMVDPRSEFTINPPNGIICAPFATDKSKTLYAQDIYLLRPYIETVCRQRFNKFLNQTNQTAGQGAQSATYQSLLAWIKNTNNVKNQDLLSKLSGTPTQTVADQVLIKNVNIMNSMVNILSSAIKTVQDAERLHQWVPIPSAGGPEYGSTTPDVFLVPGPNGAILDPIITNNPQYYQQDIDILTLTAQVQLQNVNSTVQEVDLGNFAFQNAGTISDDTTSEAFGSLPQEHLDNLIKNRTALCSDAADALQTIEIIMGEFSGLGLCDILALFTALWTVDEQTLVYMLDDLAFARLYSDPNLQDSVVQDRYTAGQQGENELSGTDVLQNFETQVKYMYQLMDKLYSDIHINNTSGS